VKQDPDGAAPAVPDKAGAVFGDRLPLALRYADLLATEATVRGLIGPGEVPRLWERHLLNCAVLGELIEPGSRVIDVGSGAGLPGIPLAIARPDVHVVLVEPLLRRSSWLQETVERLGLSTVEVRRGRAEEAAGSLSAPVVTARAVAPLERLAAWCLPLVTPGGELLAMKGTSAQAELDSAADRLAGLGAVAWEVVAIGVNTLLDHTSVVRVKVGMDAPSGRRSAARRRAPRPVKRPDQRARQRDRGGDG
jgi:16S rRNA (guanine527-N7)-methyltransferase